MVIISRFDLLTRDLQTGNCTHPSDPRVVDDLVILASSDAGLLDGVMVLASSGAGLFMILASSGAGLSDGVMIQIPLIST